MTHYKYLQITNERDQRMSSLIIACTDADVLEWIVGQVQEIYPKAAPTSRVFPNKEKFSITIRVLKKNDHMVSWWIIKKLCERGWEPFSHNDYVAHLRIASDE